MVMFVGAGPGAKDLLTVRGAELLRNAEVVIYTGSLINPEVLEYCSDACEKHNSAEMTLDDVMRVILEAEQQGKTTVRLHTGDPSLYGAIREQMAVLKQKGIRYEICPGVSSFSAAAAALKTEYTLPEVAQTVIITRAEGRTPVPEGEKLKDLAAHQCTMVLFLSATLADKVREELIAGGYAPETPAAVVYRASWEEEQVFRTTLDKLPEVFENNGTAPALIIVGKVLSEEEEWYARSRLYAADFTTAFRKGTS